MKTTRAYIIGMSLMLLGLFFAFTSIAGTSESGITVISGKVVDAETQTPLIFANVAVAGSNLGTVTNTEGKFTIKFADSLQVTELSFSHIGYENQSISITKLQQQDEAVVQMALASVKLGEIEVWDSEGKSLMSKVIDNMSTNYNSQPNMQVGFYRETIKKRKKYLSISEALIEIYKSSYTKYGNDMVKIFKGRKSSDVKRLDTLMVKLQGGPLVTMLLDVAKNPEMLISRESMLYYDYTMDGITEINNRLNHVVHFKQTNGFEMPLYNGTFYIDHETFAITALEFSTNLDNLEAASSLFLQKKPMGLKFTPTDTRYIVKYVHKDGKFYFRYARLELDFDVKWKKRLFTSKYQTMSELAVTDRANTEVRRFERAERVRSNMIFADRINDFSDEDFWGEYNYVEPDESVESALKKYGKKLERVKQ